MCCCKERTPLTGVHIIIKRNSLFQTSLFMVCQTDSVYHTHHVYDRQNLSGRCIDIFGIFRTFVSTCHTKKKPCQFANGWHLLKGSNANRTKRKFLFVLLAFEPLKRKLWSGRPSLLFTSSMPSMTSTLLSRSNYR